MSEKILPDVLDSLDAEYTIPPGEVIIGDFARLSSLGEPIVNIALGSGTRSLTAISTVSLSQHQIGRKVALMFVEGDISKPIIIGLVYSALHEIIENFELTTATDSDAAIEPSASNAVSGTETEMRVDGKKVVLEAQEEIVLKCGDASITLNKSGKISIRGKYILNRSTGVNRILGGSVQVN